MRRTRRSGAPTNGRSGARWIRRCWWTPLQRSWGSTIFAVGQVKPHYRSRVALAEWAPRTDGAGVTFTIEADRFLQRMVRFLVGAMVDVALGRRPLDALSRLLTATDNQAASPPAPPQGLYLVAVRYPADLYAEA